MGVGKYEIGIYSIFRVAESDAAKPLGVQREERCQWKTGVSGMSKPCGLVSSCHKSYCSKSTPWNLLSSGGQPTNRLASFF